MNYYLIKIKSALLIFLLAGFLIAQDNEWEVVGQMPLAVKGGQALVKDSLIYVIGGFTDSTYSASNAIQVYNPRQNSWEILSGVLGEGRYGLAAANYRHEMLFFGGASGSDSSLKMWNFKDPVYTYERDQNFNREFSTAQVSGNDLYIFGGRSLTFDYTDTSKLSYLICYNIPTASFTDLNDLTTSVFPMNQNPVQQMSALLDDNIFVIGGALNGVLDDIHKFNITRRSWETLSIHLLSGRAAGVALKTGDNTFAVIGGYNESAPALATAEEVLIPGIGYYEQSQMPQMNEARSELMAVFFDTSIYVFGGKDVLGHCLSSVERLKIEENTTPVLRGPHTAPTRFQLFANYPNPFGLSHPLRGNPQTVIRYRLSVVSDVELTVYNVLGQKVRTLVNEHQRAGDYSVIFHAQNLPGGIYFYRLKVGAFEQVRKMALVR